MSNEEKQRRLLLVVGIGRSGTSLLSGLLGRLGFHVPKPEVQADETNPRGFGEPRWAVDFHTRLMRERRITVFDSRPAAWELAATAVSDPAIVDELRSWLRDQFVGVENVVIKDPRIGWFLPLWRHGADDLGAAVSFATMLRHPAQVVKSARASYGDWQNDASRTAAWLNVTLFSELATRGSRRAFVRYDELMSNWTVEIARLARATDLPWLLAPDAGRHPDAAALVDPSLRRAPAGWEDVDAPASVLELADSVWQTVSRLSAETSAADKQVIEVELDAARAAFVELYTEAEAIAQSSITAVKPRSRRTATAAPARPAWRPSVAVRLVRMIPLRYRQRVPLPVRRVALKVGRGVVYGLRR
jgi:hypothetical protein